MLQNTAVLCDKVAVCGAKGWISPDDKSFKKDDEKIYRRELIRFEYSIKQARELSDTVIAALHYPPDEAFWEIVEKYDVKKCVFGHLHGKRAEDYKIVYKNSMLVSADFLRFSPICVI